MGQLSPIHRPTWRTFRRRLKRASGRDCSCRKRVVLDALSLLPLKPADFALFSYVATIDPPHSIDESSRLPCVLAEDATSRSDRRRGGSTASVRTAWPKRPRRVTR